MTVRGWLAARTLRTRLTAGILVLLVVSCAGIGIATSITLRGFLVDRLDQQLAQAGSRLDVSLEHSEGPDGGAVPPAPGAEPGKIYFTQRLGQLVDNAEQQAKAPHVGDERVSLRHGAHF